MVTPWYVCMYVFSEDHKLGNIFIVLEDRNGVQNDLCELEKKWFEYMKKTNKSYIEKT